MLSQVAGKLAYVPSEKRWAFTTERPTGSGKYETYILCELADSLKRESLLTVDLATNASCYLENLFQLRGAIKKVYQFSPIERKEILSQVKGKLAYDQSEQRWTFSRENPTGSGNFETYFLCELADSLKRERLVIVDLEKNANCPLQNPKQLTGSIQKVYHVFPVYTSYDCCQEVGSKVIRTKAVVKGEKHLTFYLPEDRTQLSQVYTSCTDLPENMQQNGTIWDIVVEIVPKCASNTPKFKLKEATRFSPCSPLSPVPIEALSDTLRKTCRIAYPLASDTTQFYHYGSSYSFVVNSEKDYQKYIKPRQGKLPFIDFSKYTLIAGETATANCNYFSSQKIEKCDTYYLYSIEYFDGACAMPSPLPYFAIVPKVPNLSLISVQINPKK